MRRIFLLAALAAAAFLTFVAAGSADQGYTDPGGDGKSGTDIINLTVRNDGTGLVQFQVQSVSPIVANHAIALSSTRIGTRRRVRPGRRLLDVRGPGPGIGFFAWQNGGFVAVNPASFVVGAAAANITEFRSTKPTSATSRRSTSSRSPSRSIRRP